MFKIAHNVASEAPNTTNQDDLEDLGADIGNILDHYESRPDKVDSSSSRRVKLHNTAGEPSKLGSKENAKDQIGEDLNAVSDEAADILNKIDALGADLDRFPVKEKSIRLDPMA